MATLPSGVSSFFGRFLGNAVSAAAGVAIGESLSPVLETSLRSFLNEQWTAHANVPPPAGLMAEGLARGITDATTAGNYAKQSGYGDDQFAQMTAIAQKYPELGALIQLQRRGTLADGTFDTAGAQFTTLAQRLGFPEDEAALVAGLIQAFLAPAELANAIQQGHVTDEGILPPIGGAAVPAGGVGAVTAPDGQGPTTIPATVVALDPITEAQKSGIDLDRLTVLANLVGLPPAQHELLQMWNRGIITEDDVDIGIREGHQKTKWTLPFKRLRWSVLSELQYVEARVRGWITNDELYAGGALTGYTKAQLDLLHSTHGRPISARAVSRGLARGGVRLDPVADFTGANPQGANGEKVDPIPDTLFKAMQQSNIQQQWYDLERRDIVNYPSLFMLNRLAIADPTYIPRAVTILGYLIYDPVDITAIEAYWKDQTGAAGTVKKETVAQLTSQYLAGVLTREALTATLASMGYTAQQASDLIETAEFKATSAVRTKNTKLAEKQYVAVKTSEAQARQQLAELGWPANVIDNYIAAWNIERGIQVTTLTVPQIAAALKAGALLASVARPLLADLGENPNAIETIIATAGADPTT